MIRVSSEARFAWSLAGVHKPIHFLAYINDRHTLSVVVEMGGGLVLTGDESDLQRLAAPYPNSRPHNVAPPF